MTLTRQAYFASSSTIAIEIYVYTDPDGKEWFKGREVASALKYAKPRNAIAKHVDPANRVEWSELVSGPLETPKNWHPRTVFVNTSGLISLIMRSNKPEARRFQKWATTELLNRDGSSEQMENLKTEIATLHERNSLLEDVNTQLNDKLVSDRERKAVFTEQSSTDIIYQLYRHKDQKTHYYHVRRQRRTLEKALFQFPVEEYDLVLEKQHIGNAINVPLRIKEKLTAANIPFISNGNHLMTDEDIVALAELVFEEAKLM